MSTRYQLRPVTTEDVRAHSIEGPTTVLYDTKVLMAGDVVKVTRYMTRKQGRGYGRKERTTGGGSVWQSVESLSRFTNKEDFDHYVLHRKRFKTDAEYMEYKAGRLVELPLDGKKERRKDSIQRSITTAVDLVRCNFTIPSHKYGLGARFFRLSQAPEHYSEDPKVWYKQRQLFARRYEKRLGRPLQMVYILERGEETGRMHAHAMIFNAPRMSNEWWDELWKVGQVNAQTPGDGKGHRAIIYMLKDVLYMTKDFCEKHPGTRLYSCTRGLKRPTEYLLYWQIEPLLKQLQTKGYQIREVGIYDNEHRGKVVYQHWLPPPN